MKAYTSGFHNENIKWQLNSKNIVFLLLLLFVWLFTCWARIETTPLRLRVPIEDAGSERLTSENFLADVVVDGGEAWNDRPGGVVLIETKGMFGWAFENPLLVKGLLVVDLIEIELLKKNI